MTEKLDPERCSASVPFGGRAVSFYQCSRKPKVWRGGKGYCGTHDPVAVAAKRQAANDARKAEERREEDALKAAERRCKALGHGEPHWHHSFRGPSTWSGGVVLTPEEADALIARLKGKG